MITINFSTESDAARSWEGSAVLGVSPMSDCRGFPHSLLHQERVTSYHCSLFPVPCSLP
ncbi:MAG: hypothetical protein F6K55_06625 [Moorea sp. SIO4A3]|nr:hypothetical protein [Moorena sp. SIO4A3]